MPVDPQYFPEAALLVAAMFSGVASVRFLVAGRRASALKAVGGGVACLLLTIVLAKTTHPSSSTPALLPAAKSSTQTSQGAMMLVLGGVPVRAASSERYLLSVEGKRFLELELHRAELRVSCTVEAEGGEAAKIVRNTVPVRSGTLDVRKDPHSLVVLAGGKDVLWVRYADPSRIEIAGDFFERTKTEETRRSVHLISFRKGIEWAGGRIAEGAALDLRDQGPGRIDFGAAGEVRVASGE